MTDATQYPHGAPGHRVRVRVVEVYEGDYETGNDVIDTQSFDEQGVRRHGWGAPNITAMSVLEVGERWEEGDIVRNADNPTDLRLWRYSITDDPVGSFSRRNDGKYETWWEVTALPRSSGRASLPTNLTLLVRGGQPVAGRG